LLRHIANIRRLLSGTELSLSDSSAQEPPVS
jgi:hypothetical protein